MKIGPDLAVSGALAIPFSRVPQSAESLAESEVLLSRRQSCHLSSGDSLPASGSTAPGFCLRRVGQLELIGRLNKKGWDRVGRASKCSWAFWEGGAGSGSVSMGTTGTGRLLRAPKRETWHRFWHLASGEFPEGLENVPELVSYRAGWPRLGMPRTLDALFHPQLPPQISGRSCGCPESLNLVPTSEPADSETGKVCEVPAPAWKISLLQGL